MGKWEIQLFPIKLHDIDGGIDGPLLDAGTQAASYRCQIALLHLNILIKAYLGPPGVMYDIRCWTGDNVAGPKHVCKYHRPVDCNLPVPTIS